jgi:hypothetical protein
MHRDFLAWDVKQGDRTIRIGVGSVYRSLAKLAGEVTKTSLEHPENWKALSPDKNPFTKWYRSHASPAVGMTWDAFSGKDFLGKDTTIGSVGGQVLPLMLDTLRRKPGVPLATPLEFGASALGLSAYEPGPLSAGASEVRKDAAYINKRAGEIADIVLMPGNKSRWKKVEAELIAAEDPSIKRELKLAVTRARVLKPLGWRKAEAEAKRKGE